MFQSKSIISIFLVTGLVLAQGCGKKEKNLPKQPRRSKVAGETAGGKKADPMQYLPGAIVDTLRAKKRVFGVTKDEYFEDRGGVIGNDRFVVHYPPGKVTITHAMYLLEEAEFARRRFMRELGDIPVHKLHLVTASDLDHYRSRTGRDWWYYAEIKPDTIIFSPVYILRQRGIGTIAITHEICQWAIMTLSSGRAPRWLEEGLSSYLSEEKVVLVNQLGEFKQMKLKMTPAEVEKVLLDEKDKAQSRIAYYNAFKMTEKLADKFGARKLYAFAVELGNGSDEESAAKKIFGVSYSALLDIASRYEVEKKWEKKRK